MKNKNTVITSAPGRVCLFGEHQDYLNLPVIPCAISLRTNIKAEKRADHKVFLDLPDINSTEEFYFNGSLNYKKERDYFKSSLNVLKRKNFTFSNGLDAIVKGNIPINSGTSSSSALIVAWIKLLAIMSDQNIELDPVEIAEYAFAAEVAEFNEPGGKMDHYSTAIGGVFFLDFEPKLSIKIFDNNLQYFVLGDSMEPKNTKSVLAQVKYPMQNILSKIISVDQKFNLRNVNIENLLIYNEFLSKEEMRLLIATKKNYDITIKAKNILEKPILDHHTLGKLLNEEHQLLRDELKISTNKIDKMIEAALDAGSYGAKINGSGGGGCMFAYVSNETESKKVAKSIVKAGGKAYIIQADKGVSVDSALNANLPITLNN